MTDPWAISGIPVEVRRSARRRTVALQVRPGAVTLYAPSRVPLETLREIVDARREWIARHLEAYAIRSSVRRVVGDGEVLPFLGEELTIRVAPDTRTVRREGELLHVPPGSPEMMEQAVERWTRRACLPIFRTLVGDAATRVGASGRLGRVQVTAAQQRWGSCNVQGDIRVHWKLSRAPRPVLDYVTVHEAAHLLEFNHSRRYWDLVERVMPDYRVHREWLKEHGHTL
ncbi:M48 family metallopeptidase [uncultured Deinococcus sp.]|uniref:M48 family metallopeptidase n=1 Tax=uncultured Deinococcus sp. TaxID=158789 RepID=UPI0025E64A62|nr:SprT family zinc-dependent metalloprotease [uncultured Deinococcus sp.]